MEDEENARIDAAAAAEANELEKAAELANAAALTAEEQAMLKK